MCCIKLRWLVHSFCSAHFNTFQRQSLFKAEAKGITCPHQSSHLQILELMRQLN